MTQEEIVMRLIGPVSPVGETNCDNERFINLQNLIELTTNLLDKIQEVAKNKTAYDFSVKRAGLAADKFLDEIKTM